MKLNDLKCTIFSCAYLHCIVDLQRSGNPKQSELRKYATHSLFLAPWAKSNKFKLTSQIIKFHIIYDHEGVDLVSKCLPPYNEMILYA